MEQGTPTYSYSDVSKHNTSTDCWVVIFDKVYDLTKFMAGGHSGGYAPMSLAGLDATPMFVMIHPNRAFDILDSDDFHNKYFKGYVQNPRHSRESYSKKDNSYKNIKATIEDALSNKSLKQRDDPTYHAVAIISFLIVAIAYSLYISMNSMFFAIAFGFLVYVLLMPVIHSATHGAITKNWRLANVYSLIASIPIGTSPYKWRWKHFRHHNDTMTSDDQDNKNYPYARLDINQKVMWFHKYQYIYIPLYLTILHMNYIIEDVVFTFYRIAQAPFEQLSYFIMFALFVLMMFVIPGKLFGFKRAAMLFLAFSISLSILSASTFTTNHLVPDTMYNDDTKRLDIARSQIEGSHNVCTHKPYASNVLNLLTGGLNHQIEHHMFPSTHYFLYPFISKILKTMAQKQNMSYVSTNTGLTCGFIGSQRKFIRHLKQMGADVAT